MNDRRLFSARRTPRLRELFSFLISVGIALGIFGSTAAHSAITGTPVVIERFIYTFVIEADGSSREILTSTDRITSELGVSEHSETYFNYSTSKSTFRVHEAYTVTPRGERINVPAKAIRYVDEASDGETAMFTDAKDVVIVFPNTSVGARLVTVTEEHNHTPAYPGHYTLNLSTKGRYIVEHSEYRLFVHPRVKLNQHSFGLEPKGYTPLTSAMPQVQRQAEQAALKKGYKFLGFQYKNNSVRPPEPDEVDLGEGGALLLLSTFEDHRELAGHYQKQAGPKTKATPAIADMAKKITAGKTSDFERDRITGWSSPAAASPPWSEATGSNKSSSRRTARNKTGWSNV